MSERMHEVVEMSDQTVAVLGLGTMGRGFAANLARAGFAVSGYNRTIRPDYAGIGFAVGDDAAEVVRGAQVVIVMLTDASATRAVLLAPATLAALEPDAVVVNMGTIGVEAIGELARALAEARPDVVFVDAPVSGSKIPAQQGTVTILASSDADTAGDAAAASAGSTGSTAHPLRARLSPVFDAIGRRTVWLGGTGAGTAMKVVVNTWLVHVMHGIAETALLADSLGITPETLIDTLSGGPLDVPYAGPKLRKIAAGDFSAEMALSLGAKDARLAVDAGAGLDLPVSELIASTWTQADRAGLAADDISVIYTALRDHMVSAPA
jgi:3-hydroxyisobutyrate dehydrogenase